MDTGYPSLIPEPLDNPVAKKSFTTPSVTNQDNPQGTDTRADLTGSPSTNEKAS